MLSWRLFFFLVEGFTTTTLLTLHKIQVDETESREKAESKGVIDIQVFEKRQPHMERTKKDRNDIEVGNVSQNL